MDTKRQEQLKEPAVQALARALAAIQTPAEAEAVLVDLFTAGEIEDLAQRLDVARRLAAGDAYAAVQKATGASSTTVSRVSRFLNGDGGGYRLILERLDS